MIHLEFEDKIRTVLSVPFVFPNDIIDRLKEDERIWKNYQSFSDPYKKQEAESAVAEVSDKTTFEAKISATANKYDAFKITVETEKQKAEASSPKKTLRKSLFGDVEIGDDMNFGWVNKDNIANVYDNFVTTVSNNKDSYSREDWDEIKLLYEALDAHKNTVEKKFMNTVMKGHGEKKNKK